MDECERSDRDPGLDLERLGVDEPHHRFAALGPFAVLPHTLRHDPAERSLDPRSLQTFPGQCGAGTDREQLAASDVALRDGFIEAAARCRILRDQLVEPLDLRVEIGEPGTLAGDRRLILRERLPEQRIVEPRDQLAFGDHRADLGGPFDPAFHLGRDSRLVAADHGAGVPGDGGEHTALGPHHHDGSGRRTLPALRSHRRRECRREQRREQCRRGSAHRQKETRHHAAPVGPWPREGHQLLCRR